MPDVAYDANGNPLRQGTRVLLEGVHAQVVAVTGHGKVRINASGRKYEVSSIRLTVDYTY
jgi:hypothetical protein